MSSVHFIVNYVLASPREEKRVRQRKYLDGGAYRPLYEISFIFPSLYIRTGIEIISLASVPIIVCVATFKMAGRANIAVAPGGGSERRLYFVKIEGYSRTKELLRENEKFMASPSFSAGGHDWFVNYFPNGNCIPGFVSVYLVLDSADAKDVEAKFKCSLLDNHGVPVSSHSKETEHIFPSKGSDWGFSEFIRQVDLEGSPHLIDDCYTIGLDVTVTKEISSSEETTSGDQSVVIPPSDLHRHLRDILKNTDGADVSFQVGGERFCAHRCVLAARSPVFKAELFGAMAKDTSTGDPIEICDMEAHVFRSLLHFVYTDEIMQDQDSSNGGEEARGDVVVMAGHLLVAADRYDIERLKLMCEKKLCSHINTDMVATSLALAEQHGCRVLKEACFRFLASPSNLEAMVVSDGYEHLRSCCPAVLKELVASLLPAELRVVAKDIIMAV